MAKNTTRKTPWFLISCLGLVVLLRIPSLFEPYWYGDEGIYLTLGLAIKKGLVLYRDIHDNKPPLLYLLAALAGNVAWFRAILLNWMLISTIFFWKLINYLFPKQEKLAKISLLFFTILSSIPLIEGNIANAEIFLIGPIIAGFYTYLTAKKWWQYFLSGILFSTAVLFKMPALFDFCALFAFVVITLNKKKILPTISNSFILAAGFFVPLLISVAYFAFHNALGSYLSAAFLQNIGYLSSWKTGTMTSVGVTSKSGLLFRGIGVAVITFFLFIFRKKFSPAIILVFLWFLFSLFAALLSERPYPHYLLQILPPLSLLIGILFSKTAKIVKLLTLGLVVVLAANIILVSFWAYPVFGYYSNFIQYVSGSRDQRQYFAWFDPQVNQTYSVANFLLRRTATDEPIFIWGDEPFIYALSRRLPATRLTVAYHIVDFNGYGETIQELQKQKPRWLIVMSFEKRPFPELFEFLRTSYVFETNIGAANIFRRRSII